MLPIVITDKRGEPLGLIRDEDAVIFFNFRADRARQITRALTDPTLEEPPRSSMPQRLHFVTMTQYDKSFTLPYVLAQESLGHILAQVFADRKLRNLRVAETEKYAHVTYFFNGGVEKAFPGEERIMVPSPEGGHLRPQAGDERGGDRRRRRESHRRSDLRLPDY